MNISKNIFLFVIIIFIIFGWAESSWAAPSISDVSGIFANGSQITISGSGFGTKEAAPPIKFDNFEQCTVGDIIQNGWSVHQTTTNPPRCSQDYLRTNSERNFRADLGPGDTVDRNSYIYYTHNSACNRVFVSFWVRFDWGFPGLGTEDYQVKLWRITNNGINTDYPEISNFNWTGINNPRHYYQVNYGSGAESYAAGTYPINSWFLVELQAKENDVRLVNGVLEVDANGSLEVWHSNVFGPISKPSNQMNIVTRDILDSWDSFIFGQWLGNVDQTGIDEYADIYFDDIYIDNSWARVIIGDQPTYESCAKREMQIPASWSNESIQFDVNQGSFNNGQQAYLYVVDSEGAVNTNGYLITFGTGGGDNDAPANPNGLSVS